MAREYRLLRVFYNPPPGTPPLEFESQGLHTLMPPDQYWKKEIEEYVVGFLMHPKLNTPRLGPDGKPKVIKGKREKWVPDEAKNKALKEGRINPPKNFMDLTGPMNRELGSSKYSELAQYLRKETDVLSEHRRTFDEMRAAQEKEIQELEAKHEAAKRRIKLATEAAEKDAVTAEEFLKKTSPSQNKAKNG